ncbi:hypothetical protein DFR29_11021 [Tahibacter aquaticus]|uniref:Uncharacterized protein n=1 Tax=Tahibacter aquaticus TaxID=520092 RepID=A0A4R6YT32_9GAMM|nr:hypothetical protein [Tahibacter aquaticus]TDR41539.1 hypothetical protein DFR29_11021 [Tahibacter aquaticus]
MPPKKPAAPPRVALMFALALGIPLAVIVLLKSMTAVGDGSGWLREQLTQPAKPRLQNNPTTLAQAKAEQKRGLVVLAPNVDPAGATPRLGPGDAFYRQLSGGVVADPGDVGSGGGVYLQGIASKLVRKPDVLAMQVTYLRESSGSYNLFAGSKMGPFWQESIDWCIRLRYEPGQEGWFAYSIWRLGQEPFADLFGVPLTHAEQQVSPDNALTVVDPARWQNLLLPINTMWQGEGKYDGKASLRKWTIKPESTICDTARAEAKAS